MLLKTLGGSAAGACYKTARYYVNILHVIGACISKRTSRDKLGEACSTITGQNSISYQRESVTRWIFSLVLYVYATMVFRPFNSFPIHYTIINFLFTSLNMISETLLKILFFCDWSMFYSANLSLVAGKIRKI